MRYVPRDGKPKPADNNAMHRSREAGRFQMDNHSSRPGDCGRYATASTPWPTLTTRNMLTVTTGQWIGSADSLLTSRFSFPRCECDRAMTFLCQIYFSDKELDFVSHELLAIQLYSCFDCFECRIETILDNAELNSELDGQQLSQIEYAESTAGTTYSRVLWGEYTYWRDIVWHRQTDPSPTQNVDAFWNDDELLPEHQHLLDDKFGGCFPTVDEGGTPAIDLGIVAQLSIDATIYVTKRDGDWSFFRY